MSVFATGREKRDKFPYRKKYLKHNKGILGSFYVCSQCLAIIKEKDMEVDHIIPNSKWFAPNRVFNCVACCVPCNRSKSDKITPTYLIKSIIAKIMEELIIFIQNLIVGIIRFIVLCIFYVIRLLLSGLYTFSPIRIMLSLSVFYLIFKVIS